MLKFKAKPINIRHTKTYPIIKRNSINYKVLTKIDPP